MKFVHRKVSRNRGGGKVSLRLADAVEGGMRLKACGSESLLNKPRSYIFIPLLAVHSITVRGLLRAPAGLTLCRASARGGLA